MAAQAHSFGKLYNLPVPFWMYLWGAAAALLVSFLIIGYFITQTAPAGDFRSRDLGALSGVRTLRAISVCGLLLCIATGLWGSSNAYLNFNMTFFWIVFVLGFTYLSAGVGDLYALINPWRSLAALVERVAPGMFRGRVEYPLRFGVWPALGFYMAFIWIELFFRVQPLSLSVLLLIYSAINLGGAWLVGAPAWFRHCEFFGVFLRLVAKMAPLQIVAAADPAQRSRVRLRAPFVGLLDERAGSASELVFVLFMLSSTAYDGLRETQPWARLFWVDIHQLLKPWVGDNIVQAYPVLIKLRLAFDTFSLLLSPFFYLAIYGVFIGLAKWITRSPLSLGELALRFAYSLLPIALVYNITHYYTLIITQGLQILRLVSDPFGWGWNLFGTARWLPAPVIPDMGTVWHTQVGLILLGHIVSVYLAHLEALRIFPTRRAATLSQLPMLLLMVAFTTIGLWILAQPITSGQVAG